MNVMKKGSGRLIGVLGIIMVWLLGTMTVAATQSTEIDANILLEITQDTQLYEQPDTQAAVVGTLEKGTPVFSVEASKENWCKVSYQELSGYVPISTIRIYNSEELEQELKQAGESNKLLFEEIEYVKTQKQEKIMWGSVIVVLVAAMFTVGIASAVLKNKKGKI